MSLEDYTESDRTEHDAAKLKLARMLSGRRYEDRISAGDLAQHVKPSESTVRSLIRRLRSEYGIAVYSRGSGYYEIQTADELAEVLGKIDDQIETRQATKRELTAAYNRK